MYSVTNYCKIPGSHRSCRLIREQQAANPFAKSNWKEDNPVKHVTTDAGFRKLETAIYLTCVKEINEPQPPELGDINMIVERTEIWARGVLAANRSVLFRC